MKITERDVQNAIIEALLFDNWLILRVNQGGMYRTKVVNGHQVVTDKYVKYAYWQALGMDAQDSGISDVIAVKVVRAEDEIISVSGPMILAVEVKAPGKKGNVTAKQQAFLDAVTEHGGIGIVVDCLEDIKDYLERAEVQ